MTNIKCYLNTFAKKNFSSILTQWFNDQKQLDTFDPIEVFGAKLEVVDYDEEENRILWKAIEN
ncbi:hypothetical protein EP331_00350 [bacterium]|nr:MAG: hypothetical protein EP331_00350 [bacterium]